MNLKRINKGQSQVLTKDDGTQILISYSTPVAAFIQGKGCFRTEKKFSVTTSKHINQWLKSFFGEGFTAYAEVRPQSFFDALV